MKKLVVSHLTGNANVKAALYGFAHAGILAEYHVSMAAFPNSWLYKLGAVGPLSEIRRRHHEAILKPYTKLWPWMEIGRMIAAKAGIPALVQKETAKFYIDAVVRNLDKHVASQLKNSQKAGANAVYGYEDTIQYAFVEAKKLGMACLYDLPIGYWRSAHRLLDEERERWPEWIPTLTGLKDSEDKLARKDDELAMADQIFVASSFTAKTLQEYPGKLAPVQVIPYGFPLVTGERNYDINAGKKPLKLLFVGGLSQRKGIADLFAAADSLGRHVQLTIVGVKKNDDCLPLNAALARHNWIPSLSHSGVLKLMREHDVLVFPSLFEGFGLVITEAMSQGTPVITTNRTVGPDFIEHGKNGWLVQAGSTTALQEAIENLIGKHELIAEVGRAAMETARNRSWTDYGNELATAIADLQLFI